MIGIDNLSYWEKTAYVRNIDFLIIGSGIVGLSTSIFLKRKYKDARILIIERGYLPSGASTKNAGFSCFGSPTELYDDLQSMPEQTVWETFSSRYMGLTRLFELVSKDAIAYEQCKSWDIIAENDSNNITNDFIKYINNEAQKLTGEENIYYEDRDISSQFGFEGVNTSYCNRLEGSIYTGKMIKELYKKAVSEDIMVLFGINADSMEHSEKENTINTPYGQFKASNTIIATNGFAKQWIKDDVFPARAQVLITNEIKNLKVKGTFHYNKGYYYFRNVGNRILLGGGRNLDLHGETTEEFGLTKQIQDKLNELLQTVIIPNQPYTIEDTWSGIMGVGENKSPIIKKINNNTAIGVRMGGMGVALGSQVGKTISNLF